MKRRQNPNGTEHEDETEWNGKSKTEWNGEGKTEGDIDKPHSARERERERERERKKVKSIHKQVVACPSKRLRTL